MRRGEWRCSWWKASGRDASRHCDSSAPAPDVPQGRSRPLRSSPWREQHHNSNQHRQQRGLELHRHLLLLLLHRPLTLPGVQPHPQLVHRQATPWTAPCTSHDSSGVATLRAIQGVRYSRAYTQLVHEFCMMVAVVLQGSAFNVYIWQCC